MAHSQKEVASSSNSIAPLSRMRDTEDDRMIALLLSEEYAKMDGAVGRRLTSLPSIPVIRGFFFFFLNSSMFLAFIV